MPDNEKFVEGVKKEKIEQRIEKYNAILSAENVEKESAEYIKAQDVIEEVINLLKKAKPEYSFVESVEIEKQIKYYQKMLKYLDKNYLSARKEELMKLIETEKRRIKELGEESAKTASSNVDQEYIDKVAEELKERIANREAMIAGRGDELAPEAYEQLKEWKKELSDLEAGTISDRILTEATALEISALTGLIANREAMIAGRGDELAPAAYEQLKAWKEKLSLLKENSYSTKKTESKLSEYEEELREITEVEKVLDSRDEADVNIQKRVIENRIAELEEIYKEKELFKINEKGEVIIDYPDIPTDIDIEAIRREYEMRRQDMLDKFYGNKEKSEEYSIKMEELQWHIVEVEFEFIDDKGQPQKGIYQTVKPYEGMEEALEFMQLEEYAERLERLTKAQAGDKSVYDDIHFRNKEGQIVKLSPEKAKMQDELYIQNNNNSYNRLVSTRKNLMTLGKYGEKVDYNKFQEGQPVRNTLRAVGNAAKFVRNHVTAPINKFIGSKIVSPIYAKVTEADDPSNVAGLYSNKLTHRYVARREYFESQGKGYFSSRFNSIFKAKEGNKAILAAGAYDIQESLKRKYTEIATKEAMAKKVEFASKSIDEKIAMLQADLEKAQDDTARAKLQATLEETKKAKLQIERDRALNEKTATAQTIQTDAVDISQHDIANKENVTRTITGVKVLTRLGIRKLVGPKIKEWLLEHTQKPETIITDPTPEQIEEALNVPDQKWIDSTYKMEETPVTEMRLKSNADMSDIMSANAGKQIEGYYSVYGGEARPAMYDVTGNEKITAIFKQVGEGGHGLSDTAGLKAPVLTNGTFAQEFLDANGVLKQDVTLDQILGAVGNNSIKPEDLESLYVSVGDRYWTKLSDLCSQMTQEVTVGTEMQKVIDVAGHYVPLTEQEKLEFINKALLDPMSKAKIDALKTVSTTMVENTRVTRVLDGLGIAYKGIDGALIADDIYENVRDTYTDVPWEKPSPRHYDAKTQFTGDRKIDMARAKQAKTSKEKAERDER